MATIIGLSGRRGVGKSAVSDILVRDHGFTRIHPFGGGKVASKGYFMHLGASPDEAERMVNGDLKDEPSPFLPDNVAPRYFMERFGKFMVTTLGPAWTIGQEVRLALEKDPEAKLLADSVVYEADVIRASGGLVVKIDRPSATLIGIETDRALDALIPDLVFDNSGSCLLDLSRRVDVLLDQIAEHQRAHDPILEF